MYSWDDVAKRTEAVYQLVVEVGEEVGGIATRLIRYYTIGDWAGKVSVMIVAFGWFLLVCLEIWAPSSEVERVWRGKGTPSGDRGRRRRRDVEKGLGIEKRRDNIKKLSL